MTRFLSIFTLVLMVFLFPPTALALVSNDAVPGDVTYPIKRKLEEGILFFASLSPTTKAWFSVERTQRRFKEVENLLNKDSKRSVEALDELVSQTSQAADEISMIQDEQKRVELIQDLRKAINEYDQGLEQASKKEGQKKFLLDPSATPVITPKPSIAIPSPQVSPIASIIPTPKPSAKLSTVSAPRLSPSPGQTAPAPRSTPSIRPSNPPPNPTPSVHVVQPAPPVSSGDDTQEAIDDARDKLKAIEEDLKKQEQANFEQRQVEQIILKEPKTPQLLDSNPQEAKVEEIHTQNEERKNERELDKLTR